MTLTQFVKKWQGSKVDFDGAHGCQCVDLYRQYLQDVLDIPQTPAVTGAKDIFINYGTKLKPIKEGVKADYSKGDILVWGATPTNPYGHVAILVSVYNTYNFVVFEQDGFKQDGVKLVMRSRDNLLGALWYEN